MTDEELDSLIKEFTEQLEQIPQEDRKHPLTKEQRTQRVMLRAKCEALNRIKEARGKGNFRKEVQASMDYNLLVQYGHKHPLLLNFIKSQMTWF